MIKLRTLSFLIILISISSCNEKKGLIQDLMVKNEEIKALSTQNKDLKEENIKLKTTVNGTFQASSSLETKLNSCNERNDLFERSHEEAYFENLFKYYNKEQLEASEVRHLEKVLSFLEPEVLLKLSINREQTGKSSLFMTALKQSNKEARSLIVIQTKLRAYASELKVNETLVEFLIRIIEDVDLINEQRIYLVEENEKEEAQISGFYIDAKAENKGITQIISTGCVDKTSKKLLESCQGSGELRPIKISKLILDSKRHGLIDNLIKREKIEFDSIDLSNY